MQVKEDGLSGVYDGIRKLLRKDNSNVKSIQLLNKLGLEESKFNNIHTKEQKREHLRYKWLRKEFDIIAKSDGDFPAYELYQLEQDYKSLISSNILSKHEDVYSPHSVGLQEIDLRSSQYSKTRTLLSPAYSVRQSVIFQGPKTSGIEPGFEGIEKKDILFYIYAQFPNNEERWQYIAKHKNDIRKIYDQNRDALPTYLVKSDYTRISNDIVTPDPEDLNRSKTMRNLYQTNTLLGKFATLAYTQFKKRTYSQINIASVLEVLGNDIMRAYGVPTQTQYLLPGRYSNGRLKLMLKAKWITGANILGPVYGSEDNKNYRANPVLFHRGGITYLADNSIKNLPESLPAMIILGDPDGIGSSAQNKLHLNGQFICIDTGHAFESDIIDQISEHFTINNPKFKNYSIFFAPRSETMKGVIKLAIQAGHKIPEEVLKSYFSKEELKSIKSMPEKADEQIFDDYISKFQQIKKQFNDKNDPIEVGNSKCCDEIIAQVQAVKKKVITTRDKLVKKFSKYLSLDKKSVDLIENLEKFFAGQKGTSLRSPDQTTLLQHLRIDESLVPCSVVTSENKSSPYKFSFKFNDKETFKAAYSNLKTQFNENGLSDELDEIIDVNDKNNTLHFKSVAKLDQLNKIFSEERIMKLFHPKDYAYLSFYRYEEELIGLIESLSKYGIKAKIDQHSKSEYIIAFENSIDEKFSSILSEYFENIDSTSLIISTTQMAEICKIFRVILSELERDKNIANELKLIQDLSQEIKNLDPTFNFDIKETASKNVLYYNLNVNPENLILMDIMHQLPKDFISNEINTSDLFHLRESLTSCVDLYKGACDKFNKQHKTLQHYNTFLKFALNLKQNPLDIRLISPQKIQVTVNDKISLNNFSFPTNLLSREKKNTYTFDFQSIQVFEEAISSYVKTIFGKDTKKENIKNDTYLKNLISYVIQNSEDFNEGTLNHSFCESLVNTIYSKFSASWAQCPVALVIEETENVLSEMNLFNSLSHKLGEILKLSAPICHLDIKNGNLNLRDITLPNSSEANVLLNIVKAYLIFHQDKGQVQLSQLLKTVNTHFNQLIEKGPLLLTQDNPEWESDFVIIDAEENNHSPRMTHF